MYAKAVTLMPSTWAETNEVITRNRRIGISMTGIVDFIESRGWSSMQEWMDEGYQYLNFVDTKYSEWLGVRNSVKLTTVKPAGTTSIIAGTTSGVHWPTTSGYYIRRIRFHKTDPLIPLLKKAGYHIEDDVMDSKTTVVASFPTKGLDVRSELDVSIWEKASLAAMAQRYWADNMVSVTVSFKESEQQEISPLLRSLQGQVKSLSFLPISEEGTTYAQAPYEPISEEDALKMMKKIKPLDLDAVYSSAADGSGEKFCTTDVCEIDLG
jgi:ribonucleotide reductase alpha subunit